MRFTRLILFGLLCFNALSCGKGATDATPANTATTTTTTTNPVLPTGFAKGADIGWLSEMEASGRKFYNSSGTQQDCIDVLKSEGINSIRLRVWVNPAGNYCNKADVVAMAIRAKAKGMRLMIDFHYSDTWADPAHQAKPAAWTLYDLATLQQAVYNHTYDVLNTLNTNGITPEWVQVGNECDDGFYSRQGKYQPGMAPITLYLTIADIAQLRQLIQVSRLLYMYLTGMITTFSVIILTAW